MAIPQALQASLGVGTCIIMNWQHCVGPASNWIDIGPTSRQAFIISELNVLKGLYVPKNIEMNKGQPFHYIFEYLEIVSRILPLHNHRRPAFNAPVNPIKLWEKCVTLLTNWIMTLSDPYTVCRLPVKAKYVVANRFATAIIKTQIVTKPM